MRGTEWPDGFSASNCQSMCVGGGGWGQWKLNREEMYMCTEKLTLFLYQRESKHLCVCVSV